MGLTGNENKVSAQSAGHKHPCISLLSFTGYISSGYHLFSTHSQQAAASYHPGHPFAVTSLLLHAAAADDVENCVPVVCTLEIE